MVQEPPVDVHLDVRVAIQRAEPESAIRTLGSRAPKDHLNIRILKWCIVHGMEYAIYIYIWHVG